MTKKLPARPNLEHLRSQAKTLLARMRDGDDAAARIFSNHLPEAKGLTPKQVRSAGFRLADAQAALAHKNGFAAWPGLARYVERLRSLEGTWAFRSLEVDGEKMPIAAAGDSRLLLDGDRFRMESPVANYEGIFDIDIERTPHTIDIDFVDGPEAGNRSEGIFELDGDRLTICLGFAGESRPTGVQDHARQRPRARASGPCEPRAAGRRRWRHAAAEGAGARQGVRERGRLIQRRGYPDAEQAPGRVGTDGARDGRRGAQARDARLRLAHVHGRGNQSRVRRPDDGARKGPNQRGGVTDRSRLPQSRRIEARLESRSG